MRKNTRGWPKSDVKVATAVASSAPTAMMMAAQFQPCMEKANAKGAWLI